MDLSSLREVSTASIYFGKLSNLMTVDAAKVKKLKNTHNDNIKLETKKHTLSFNAEKIDMGNFEMTNVTIEVTQSKTPKNIEYLITCSYDTDMNKLTYDVSFIDFDENSTFYEMIESYNRVLNLISKIKSIYNYDFEDCLYEAIAQTK